MKTCETCLYLEKVKPSFKSNVIDIPGYCDNPRSLAFQNYVFSTDDCSLWEGAEDDNN